MKETHSLDDLIDELTQNGELDEIISKIETEGVQIDNDVELKKIQKLLGERFI